MQSIPILFAVRETCTKTHLNDQITMISIVAKLHV